jgi:hypothetical protein
MTAQQFVTRHPDLINAIQYDGTNMQEILTWCRTITRELTVLTVWIPQMSVGCWAVELEPEVPNWCNRVEIMKNDHFIAKYRPAEASEQI